MEGSLYKRGEAVQSAGKRVERGYGGADRDARLTDCVDGLWSCREIGHWAKG